MDGLAEMGQAGDHPPASSLSASSFGICRGSERADEAVKQAMLTLP